MRLVSVTFAYLADPVVIGLTVPIVPVPSIIKLDFCTKFVVIMVVWFPIAPVLIAELGFSFWKHT